MHSLSGAGLEVQEYWKWDLAESETVSQGLWPGSYHKASHRDRKESGFDSAEDRQSLKVFFFFFLIKRMTSYD